MKFKILYLNLKFYVLSPENVLKYIFNPLEDFLQLNNLNLKFELFSKHTVIVDHI